MNKLPISGLTAFHAVAAAGSIRAAAARLQLEPSTVSHQLKALETQLEVALFIRSTRSVSLTEAGQVLMQSASPALEQLQHALEKTRAAGGVHKGVLRINTPYIGFRVALLNRLQAFQQAYPAIHLEFTFSDRLDDIASEGFHAGVRFGSHVEDNKIAVPLSASLPAVVVASPAYLQQYGSPQTPADLLQHNCFRYRFINSKRLADWDFIQGDEHFTVEGRGNFVADSQVAILDRVLTDDGLAHVPRAFVQHCLDSGQLVPLLEDYSYSYPALYLYFPKENRPLETLRVFVQFFRYRG